MCFNQDHANYNFCHNHQDRNFPGWLEAHYSSDFHVGSIKVRENLKSILLVGNWPLINNVLKVFHFSTSVINNLSKVYNRKDCCQDRIVDARIELFDDNQNSVWGSTFAGQHNEYEFKVPESYFRLVEEKFGEQNVRALSEMRGKILYIIRPFKIKILGQSDVKIQNSTLQKFEISIFEKLGFEKIRNWDIKNKFVTKILILY